MRMPKKITEDIVTEKREVHCTGCGKLVKPVVYPPIGSDYYCNRDCFLLSAGKKKERPIIKW